METWRADTIHRRMSIPKTPSSITASTLHRVVLPRIDALYLLSGRDLFRLEHVSTEFLHSRSAKEHFRQWLQRYENCRGAIRQTVGALYREYHAARVVRRFLRGITQNRRDLVITGSFASARYLESHGLEAWRPGDIDIFVVEEQVAAAVEAEYVEALKVQLSLDTVRRGWAPEDGKCEGAVGSLAFADKNGLSIPIDSRWTPRDLRIAVRKWLMEYSEAHEHQSYSEAHEHEGDACEDVMHAETDMSLTARLREMQRVLVNLPDDPQPSMLKICSTVRLTPATRTTEQRKMGMPAALLPINIIYVQLLQEGSEIKDIRECVCNNFDQAACCMTLSVSSDFEYECQELNDAADCLRRRLLRLRPQAFSCQHSDVEQQMQRILKYVTRGFHFEQ